MISQFSETTLALVGDGSATTFEVPLGSFALRPTQVIRATCVEAADDLPAPEVTAAIVDDLLVVTFSEPLIAASDEDDVYFVRIEYAY